MYHRIHCSNSSPILELSVKCASQICYENINKPLDGAYLACFGIDIIYLTKWEPGAEKILGLGSFYPSIFGLESEKFHCQDEFA